MDNKEFGKEMERRTKAFAVQVFKLSVSLSDSIEHKVIRNQLTKSGTSIGANYREANRSRSKADFVNKIRICECEASEVLYWLEIINETRIIDSPTINPLISEAKELLSILTSIGFKLRQSQKLSQ